MSISRRSHTLMMAGFVFSGIQQTAQFNASRKNPYLDHNGYHTLYQGTRKYRRYRYHTPPVKTNPSKKIKNKRRMRKASRKANRK